HRSRLWRQDQDLYRAGGMKPALLDELLAAKTEKRAVVLITDINNGEQALYSPGHRQSSLSDEFVAMAQKALRSDNSELIETSKGPVFVEVFNSPLRMLITGAVHIAQHLAPMATEFGYDVAIIDPRAAFAASARLPGVNVIKEWPNEAMRCMAVDNRTAVVALTHDPKIDESALAVALRSEAFYIGALGSKKTHEKRRERLSQQGFSETELARIHAPIGLAIGAQSPAEIALSIMAQITQVLHAGAAR
ncbi:MAG: XdhC family protein, partial [Burkholderiales bacterium]